MKTLIAYCGLDCESCEARLATINNNNSLRAKVAKKWSDLNGVEITPQMINCVGCRVDGAEKKNSADAIVFIYPVFWTEAPAKLVGWFDRVWSHGFAYGKKRSMKVLDKALFLVTAGNTMERLESFGLLDSMKKVMIGDRFFDRAKASDFVIFPGMSRELDSREQDWDKNLKTAYEKGRTLF